MPNLSNGFKDSDQSIVSYAIAEAQRQFADLAHPTQGAHYLLKSYREQYATSGFLAAAGAVIGVGGCIAAMGALSLPALSGTFVGGAVAALIGGGTALRQFEGKGFCEKEAKFLKQYPALLGGMALMESQGIPGLILSSAYDQTLEVYSPNRPLSAQQLHERFCDAVNAALLIYRTAEQGVSAFKTGDLIELEDLTSADALELPEGEGEVFEPEAPELSYLDAIPSFVRDRVGVTVESASKTAGVPVAVAAPASTPTAILAPDRPDILTRIISINGFLPSRLFVGGSRTGKSQLASDAGAKAREAYPEATIFYLSAGYKESEDNDYWRFANHVAGYSFKDMKPEQIRGAYEHWMKLLDEFDRCPYSQAKPKVLVCDELNTVMTFGQNSNSGKLFCEQLKGRLQLAASVGSKDGYVLWGIAPVGDMGSLGLSRGQASAFNPVFVGLFGSSWNQTTYITAVGNGLAPKHPPVGFREGDRVVGIGGEWERLPQSQQLALAGQDHRVYPESGIDAVMQAVAAQTLAQVAEIEPVDEVTRQIQAIYQYIQKRGLPIDKRGIQQAKIPALEGLNADDIGTLLDLMLEDGNLQIQDGYFTINPNKKP